MGVNAEPPIVEGLPIVEELKGHIKELEGQLKEETKKYKFELNQKEQLWNRVDALESELGELKAQHKSLIEREDENKRTYRREVICKWREMVSAAQREYEDTSASSSKPSFTEVLERQPDYLSLEPHLSDETLKVLSEEKFDDSVSVVGGPGGRVYFNPTDHFASMINADIARKESEWGLP